MPITATTTMTYPASANPCATFCHWVPTAYPISVIAVTQTAVPSRLSRANIVNGTLTKPATMEMNVRTTGIARPTGIAHAPRPARNRSARSMSASVISR